MKKLTRILMMMLVLSVGTGITSCDEIEDMIDNPVVPEPTPTPTPEPTPEPTPQPTPEEIENQRIAEAQALLEESRQEGALVNLTYTVNGVERVASFKRVGDKYVLQNPSATRADGAEGDEYVPYLMDYDTDEDPENDQDLDDADLDKDIEEEFEYEDGDDDLDDDDNLDDDDTENLDNDAIADQLEWDDTTGDDDDDDAADGEDDDEATAGTRAMKQEIPYKYCCSIAGFRGITTLADCTQALLMPRTATFTQSFAIVAENFRTRSQEPVMAFTGKIEVNGKTFTYKPSEAGTRASDSKTVKVKSARNMRITKVVFQKKGKLTYKKGNKMQVQVLPTNARVTKVTWKAIKSLKLAPLPPNGTNHKNISTCMVTPYIKKIVKITCTVKGKNSKSKSYKVKVVYATVKGVTISPSSLTFTEGDQPKQLKATVTPSNANPSVIWKSDKKDVAIVDKNGNVTPTGVGTATITCTSEDNPQKTATCTVTVNAAEVPISSLKLSQTSLSLLVGGTATLTAEVNENATVDKIVTWSVSKGTAVTVDQTGKVTAVAAGDATITAKAGEKTATCTVTVSKKAGSISFKESTVNVDNTASPFTNTLTNTGDGAVTYKSSDDSVAKVDADGKVTLMGTGTGIIITATVADSDTYHYDTNEVRYTINVSALPSNIAEPIDYGHEDSPF